MPILFYAALGVVMLALLFRSMSAGHLDRRLVVVASAAMLGAIVMLALAVLNPPRLAVDLAALAFLFTHLGCLFALVIRANRADARAGAAREKHFQDMLARLEH